MRKLGLSNTFSFPRKPYLLRSHAFRSTAMPDSSVRFDVLDKDGSARTGTLLFSNGQIQTPALLLYTRRGSPLHLTPDMVQQLGNLGQNTLVDITKL